MASQKQARAAAGQAKSGGTATRSGSGSSSRGGQQAGAGTGQTGTGPNGTGSGQGGRAQNGRAQGSRGQGGRGQGARGQDGRGPGGRPGPARGGAQVAEPSAASAAQERYGAPPWIQWTALGLSLAGLGVSIYLTIVHFTSPKLLVCSSNGAINCEKVLSSPEAMVFGVFPVAVLGLAFYVFMVAINSPWAWRSRLPVIWWTRLAGAVAGMGFVLYLIYVELIQVGNICLWCTSVHVITFLLFVLLVFTATLGMGTTAKTAR
jgi:uncharacterized membrane protein